MCCIVFISHSSHWCYIKIPMQFARVCYIFILSTCDVTDNYLKFVMLVKVYIMIYNVYMRQTFLLCNDDSTFLFLFYMQIVI